MSKQYWIGGFYIDLSRNQITQNKRTQTLAPKALAVLTCLAENQGQVVSQDDLLSQVWPNTIVSPNTLQRSIAQLRKALGDDGKGQIYIKTHAKQGYSLECDVRWHEQAGTNESHQSSPTTEDKAQKHPTSQPPDSVFKLVALVAAIALLSVLSIQFLTPDPTSPITFDTLRSLTATDDKEFDATYSPDGKYIVFHRYLGKQCVNKIWAKNIETQQEIQLTDQWAAYGSHDFSPDGKRMVFLATEACLEPIVQRNCYDLVTLDFEQALQSPQQPDVILQCKQSKVVKPKWIDDDHIAMLQSQSKRWKLINYSINDNSSTDLLQLADGGVVGYDISLEKGLIAVTSTHSNGQSYIDLIELDGTPVSSYPITRPPEIAKFRPLRPSFDPLNDQLVFSTGRQLFTLSYQGQINKINLPFADRMVQPVFHPEGNRLLMIKGPYDSDIVQLSLDQLNDASTDPYTPFDRSNLGEAYAMYQPGGDLIAFWSERSGEQQMWLNNGESSRQLTDFPVDTFIQGADWAADGQSMMVNVNSVLTQVHLNGQQQAFPLDDPVVQLFQWDSVNNSALVLVKIRGVIQLAEYNLLNAAVNPINNEWTKWALKSQDGRLIYKDSLDQFWQPGPVEPQRIEALDQQGDLADSFVVHENSIYAINSNHELWSYDLDSDTFTVLGTVREDVDFLTDITNDRLLLTTKVAAKKEVVELTVGD